MTGLGRNLGIDMREHIIDRPSNGFGFGEMSGALTASPLRETEMRHAPIQLPAPRPARQHARFSVVHPTRQWQSTCRRETIAKGVVPVLADVDGDHDLDLLTATEHDEIVWHENITNNDPTVLAGDANRDGQFDQRDIVQMLAAGKYQSGESATWWEGGSHFLALSAAIVDLFAAALAVLAQGLDAVLFAEITNAHPRFGRLR